MAGARRSKKMRSDGKVEGAYGRAHLRAKGRDKILLLLTQTDKNRKTQQTKAKKENRQYKRQREKQTQRKTTEKNK